MVLLRFNKLEGNWNIINVANKEEGDLYLDGKLYKKLLFAKAQQGRNHDAGGLVIGSEGSGKSTAAGNIMRFMTNDTFDPINHIIKDSEEAFKILKEAKKGSGLMFDEGYLLFSSTEVMVKSQRDLVKIFSIIRQKNLFFLIVAPSFFRMNSYFALDRTKFMVRIYTKKNERGFFAFYGEKKKAKLFRIGKKEHNYDIVRPNFRGRFTKCFLLENKEYERVKEQTLFSAFKTAEEKKQQTPKQIIEEFKKQLIINNPNVSGAEIGRFLGLTRGRISQIREKMNKSLTVVVND